MIPRKTPLTDEEIMKFTREDPLPKNPSEGLTVKQPDKVQRAGKLQAEMEKYENFNAKLRKDLKKYGDSKNPEFSNAKFKETADKIKEQKALIESLRKQFNQIRLTPEERLASVEHATKLRTESLAKRDVRRGVGGSELPERKLEEVLPETKSNNVTPPTKEQLEKQLEVDRIWNTDNIKPSKERLSKTGVKLTDDELEELYELEQSIMNKEFFSEIRGQEQKMIEDEIIDILGKDRADRYLGKSVSKVDDIKQLKKELDSLREQWRKTDNIAKKEELKRQAQVIANRLKKMEGK
jgi:hypothetical protein